MAIFGDLERLIDDLFPYRWPIAMLVAVALSLLATAAYRRGWRLKLWRHTLRTAVITVLLLIVAVPLSYYLLSPLWTRTTIFEESPLVAASNATVQAVPPTPAADRQTPASRMATPTATSGRLETATVPTISTAADPAPTIEPTPTEMPARKPTNEPAPEPTPDVFVPRLVSSGPLSGADDFHFAEGTAQLIETAPGVYAVRLEAFTVRNGPDLCVYLTAAPDEIGETAINLGGLSATDGSINYEVPTDIDITQYQAVVIWCRAFSVLFDSAPLIAS